MMYSFDTKRKQPASHVSAIINNPRLNLLGVCDIDKKLREFKNKIKTKFEVISVLSIEDIKRVKKLLIKNVN